MTVDLAPGSQAWASRVSPSKLAAILGVSPWESPRSLWHKMRGDVPWGETNVDQERGHLLEAAVLEWWRRRHPDHTDWADQPSFTPAEWLVATPDAICTDSAERVLVEAKTSADYDAFGEPGTDEIPTYYLTQVYFAAHLAVLAGEPITRIYVPLLGPRLRFEEYVVEYDPEIGQQLMATAERWRDMLLTDEAPDLDDTVATFDVMRKLHPEIERGTEVKVALEVGRALVEGAAALKAAEAADRLARSTVLEQMGRAQYATCDGVRVARRQPRGEAVTFVVVGKPTDLTPDTDEESAA